MPTLGPRAFQKLQGMFRDVSGIELSPEKRTLIETRLRKRVDVLGLGSFDAYCQLLESDAGTQERQTAIDLLTTNETYFFREPEHFVQLASAVQGERMRARTVRVWSAACSTGEEPYSIAMTLLDKRPDGNWELLASDLSGRVLERARRGVFPMARLEHMPPGYLKRFCLRGTGANEGTIRVAEEVRERVRIFSHNLMHDDASLGVFDVIFLRNVLIYFESAKKHHILERIVQRLRVGGLLFVGHAEPLLGHDLPLGRVQRAVFERLG